MTFIVMSTLIFKIQRDPAHAEFAFEIAADGIAMSRSRPRLGLFRCLLELRPGIIAQSPVKENILDPAAFAEAVRKLVPPASGRARRSAVLILPDNAVRIAVLDFDSLPDKEEERRPLIYFRLRKSVPFDIDDAALSYFPQSRQKSGRRSGAVRNRRPLRSPILVPPDCIRGSSPYPRSPCWI